MTAPRVLLGVLMALFLAGVLWLQRPAAVPAEFIPLTTSLRTFSVLDAELDWPDPSLPTSRWVTVHMTADPQVSLTTDAAALVWGGRSVKLEVEGLSIPFLDLPDRAEELWGELRSGLSGSTWRAIDPPALGILRPAADAAWASVQLPFDWAEGVEVMLAVDRGDGRLRYVVLAGAQAPFTVSAVPARGGPRSVQLSAEPWVRLPVRSLTVR